jgi:hypothetical protein
MSIEHLASIYYGYTFDWEDFDDMSEEMIEKYIDDTWYVADQFGQAFNYHAYSSDKVVFGIECYETDDILDITDYAMSQVVKKTKEGLMEIYKEIFPNRDEIPEPRFLLIQREF